MNARLGKVFGGIILTILWVCGFLFTRPTLAIDFGAGLLLNLKVAIAIIGLLVIVFYNIFYRSSAEITKLSLTCSLTIAWLAVVFFYPFQKQPIRQERSTMGPLVSSPSLPAWQSAYCG